MEASSPSSASSMVSSSGCKKQKVDQIAVDASDRISKLPDTVLRHILSFLSITEAVKTCILSKRFDSMWTSVPKLNFYNGQDANRDLFMNFVERVLTHRDSSRLHEFTLDCLVHGDVMRINTWISAAIRRKVQMLSITLSDIKTSLVLPHCLFNSNSLEGLYLYMSHVLALPTSISFSSLRKLSLHLVIFPNDHLTQQFFSGCPVLEELDIDECNWVNLRAVSISCPNLKSLSIYEKAEDDGGGGGCQVMILTTSLEYFYCQDGFRNDYFLQYTSSLVSASLIIVNEIEKERIQEVAYRLHKLLKALQNIPKLELSGSTAEVFGSAKELFMHVPVFSNLTHLILDMDAVILDLDGVHRIVQNSPRLESLYFAGGIGLAFWSSEIYERMFNPVPSCFTSYLKTIRINYFRGREDEMGAVKILLAHAAVLEKMVIHLYDQDDTALRQNLHEQLLSLPRNSVCSINLVGTEKSP